MLYTYDIIWRFLMVESLFFQTYYSYLKGDFNSAKMFFHFLKEEFKNKKDPEALNRKQLLILKEIQFSIKNGKIEISEWVGENESSAAIDGDSPDIKQTELVKKIHFETHNSLKELLKSDELQLYNIEHPCGKYGAVDMVYYDPEIFFPVEVKRHEGKHDLIGQIAKYTLYFKLGLHMKMYFDVIPVTICNSYNAHTLKKLKGMSVVTLKYDLRGDRLKLRRV
jgi:hypothetical protein